LDATATVPFKVEYSSGCPAKAHRDDEGKATSVDFYNSALVFKVHLGDGIASSLLTEFIENSGVIDPKNSKVDLESDGVEQGLSRKPLLHRQDAGVLPFAYRRFPHRGTSEGMEALHHRRI
jgi:hypothetical protein